MEFRITAKDKSSSARTGWITTGHGRIPTPAFCPVATRASVRCLSSENLVEIGVEALLANDYHNGENKCAS